MNMESDDPKHVVLQVGAVLKRLRKERQLSLEDLSELTSVSKLTLGNIERGETNPTIGMMWKISKGLSLPLMALFSSESNVNLSRSGKGFRIAGDQKTWMIEPIFQNSSNEIYEMCRAYLQPCSSYQPEKHHQNTTEIVTVMTGTITINVNDESYILHQYDSISFRADGLHSYTNHSDDIVVLHIFLKYRT
ncbi:helix-turn-helix domain-containing protein [Brevibacillus sp. NRS-1366]|uniref:helix-turn-helix domain-containing protein n=1 Tax=Brevibacillus sp. NRS-1366 TaxID=3233899 RepID=UPI003D219D26